MSLPSKRVSGSVNSFYYHLLFPPSPRLSHQHLLLLVLQNLQTALLASTLASLRSILHIVARVIFRLQLSTLRLHTENNDQTSHPEQPLPTSLTLPCIFPPHVQCCFTIMVSFLFLRAPALPLSPGFALVLHIAWNALPSSSGPPQKDLF